jgi:hypothetical protein
MVPQLIFSNSSVANLIDIVCYHRLSPKTTGVVISGHAGAWNPGKFGFLKDFRVPWFQNLFFPTILGQI